MKSKTNLYKRISRLFSCAFMVFALSGVVTSATTTNTLKDTYGTLFGRMGTCINLSQLQNATTLEHVKSQYNSITLENEMKPDAMLGYSPNLITVEA